MTHFPVSIDIDAPADRVWAILRDVERWPQWTPTMTSIQLVEPGPLALGSRVRVRQPKLRPAEWEVTELEEGKSFTWIMRNPGLRVTARHAVENRNSGSRVTLSVDFSGFLGPLVARVTRSLNERYVSLEANSLKAYSEGSM